MIFSKTFCILSASYFEHSNPPHSYEDEILNWALLEAHLQGYLFSEQNWNRFWLTSLLLFYRNIEQEIVAKR